MKQLFISTALLFLVISGLMIGCKKTESDSSNSISNKWKPSPNNNVEKSLDSFIIKTKKNKDGSSYGCGSSISDSYYGQGYYKYPDYTLDLSSTIQGSSISIQVNSYDIPNRFVVKDAFGNTVASTSWMGYVNYSGPWGQSLNTPEIQTLNFVRTTSTTFTLTVETVAGNNYSDSWYATITCTPPILTEVSTQNAGSLHNSIITGIDNSFISEPTTLYQADSLSKIYEKSYVGNNNINLSAGIIDSSYDFRNRLLNISYSNNIIYAANTNFRAIADSMMNLSNTSILMTSAEKSLMQNLFYYFDQYSNNIIDYTTMKSDIASLKNTWSQQGFNASLNQGDISAYTLNIADSSVSYWYRYNSTYGTRIATNKYNVKLLPAWVAADAVGALAGGIGAGLDSYSNTGHVNWKSVGSWALAGAIGSSVPGMRWFKKFF